MRQRINTKVQIIFSPIYSWVLIKTNRFTKDYNFTRLHTFYTDSFRYQIYNWNLVQNYSYCWMIRWCGIYSVHDDLWYTDRYHVDDVSLNTTLAPLKSKIVDSVCNLGQAIFLLVHFFQQNVDKLHKLF